MRMRAAGLEPRVLLGGLQALQLHPYTLLLECPRTLPFAVSTQPTVHNSAESLASTADTAATAPVTDREDADSFTPDLEEVNPAHYVEPLRRSITWLPSMILERRIYLGTCEHAADPRVISALGITHVVSTSRVRAAKVRGLVYILVNKASFSQSTLKLTTNFILDAVAGGGRVLVHGCDGELHVW